MEFGRQHPSANLDRYVTLDANLTVAGQEAE
jgi:hypothetical protein